jgi:hypothetical protein
MYKLAACYIVYSTGHFISGYRAARKSFDNCVIRISVQMTDVADMGVECSNPRMWSLNKRQMEDKVHVTHTMKDHFVNNIFKKIQKPPSIKLHLNKHSILF